ncbi:MAG: UDPGP type 1 family protein [Kiritimatiellae bacterium]|nr:UDPGP type 1 family protein [Kiritimatiellia bacterium]
MTYEDAAQQLRAEEQEHLLRFWKTLAEEQRRRLLEQIALLDFAAIRRMRALLEQRAAGVRHGDAVPADVVEMLPQERAAATARGEQELRAGKVGVLLVAGGQGSRLGFEGPKGAFPIGPVSNAVLFHFHARKVLALGRAYGARLPFYIMTSDSNDAATRACFAEHGFFGLDAGDVCFFQQGMWPALDPRGRVIMDAPDHVFMSPDGHGGLLSALASSGELADMERRGLSTIFYQQVDNPLVEVADPAFVGLHLLRGADLSIKVCAKRDPQEGLGVVVKRDGRYGMVEYTELTDEQKQRRRDDGELYFRYGSVAIHLFALPFLRREAETELPLHMAHKKIPVCDDHGHTTTPKAPNGYKFEKFIFDVLPHADTLINLVFDRHDEFSPVKNATGPDSPATCKRDLIAKWARWLTEAGVEVPRGADGHPLMPVEIDPAFAHSPASLRARLARMSPPDLSGPLWLRDP